MSREMFISCSLPQGHPTHILHDKQVNRCRQQHYTHRQGYLSAAGLSLSPAAFRDHKADQFMLPHEASQRRIGTVQATINDKAPPARPSNWPLSGLRHPHSHPGSGCDQLYLGMEVTTHRASQQR